MLDSRAASPRLRCRALLCVGNLLLMLMMVLLLLLLLLLLVTIGIRRPGTDGRGCVSMVGHVALKLDGADGRRTPDVTDGAAGGRVRRSGVERTETFVRPEGGVQRVLVRVLLRVAVLLCGATDARLVAADHRRSGATVAPCGAGEAGRRVGSLRGWQLVHGDQRDGRRSHAARGRSDAHVAEATVERAETTEMRRAAVVVNRTGADGGRLLTARGRSHGGYTNVRT